MRLLSFCFLLILWIFLLNFYLSHWCFLSQPSSGGQSISDLLLNCDPFLVSDWFFCFSKDIFGDSWRFIFRLNPMSMLFWSWKQVLDGSWRFPRWAQRHPIAMCDVWQGRPAWTVESLEHRQVASFYSRHQHSEQLMANIRCPHRLVWVANGFVVWNFSQPLPHGHSREDHLQVCMSALCHVSWPISGRPRRIHDLDLNVFFQCGSHPSWAWGWSPWLFWWLLSQFWWS